MQNTTYRKLKPLSLISMGLRGLAALLRKWPLVLVAACFVSPITPHVLWEYRYQEHGKVRVLFDCDYVGLRGFVLNARYGHCPAVILIDHRK